MNWQKLARYIAQSSAFIETPEVELREELESAGLRAMVEFAHDGARITIRLDRQGVVLSSGFQPSMNSAASMERAARGMLAIVEAADEAWALVKEAKDEAARS